MRRAGRKISRQQMVSCTCLMAGLVSLSAPTLAREYLFDPQLLDGGGENVDLALVEQGGQLPGTYTVDILLNGQRVDTQAVVFTRSTSGARPALTPCLSVEQLSRYGIRVEDITALQRSGEGCADLSVIPQAGTMFNFNAQTLNLQVPQAYLRSRLQGIAPEARWDDGVPALLLNWQANASHMATRSAGGRQSNNASWVQLQPGGNLGAWRLRNATTWQKYGQEGGKWQTVYTYAERGLNGMKSRLTLGERTTPSDIFDSVPFRGGMLNSDESMVPSGLSTYAPVVRGIAQTQARVEVKQNGYTLYSSLVAPGPFALRDLNAGQSGGDLAVTVYETDGTRQVFIVPYQTPAIALHEGYLKYSLMAGQYRPAESSIDRTTVYQGTAMYGLPWNLTGYAGTQASDHYLAASVGMGLAMGNWGAVSLDGTQMRGQRRNEATESGYTWRTRYSKAVESTDTIFTLASYQYASSGYGTLSDVLDTWRDGTSADSSDRRRTRNMLTVSQSFGSTGVLSLTGARDNYWNRPGHTNSLNAAFTLFLGSMTVSLGWAENRLNSSSGTQRNDRVASLRLSVPLDRLLGKNTSATYRLTSPSDGGDTHEVGLNGRAMDRRLYWDVRQRYRPDATGGDRNNSAMRLSWNGTYGQAGASYSHSKNVNQTGVDASGGMVVYPYGVTFGQMPGDTLAVVEAPGVSGVGVNGWPGVRTDWRGYTTLGYMTPYQENLVTLNAADLPADADIPRTDMTVVPTQGAVIPARFNTRVGGRAMMTLIRSDGTPVPYGALASLDIGGAGVVGDGGQVYLTGLPDKGQVSVKWTGGQCRVAYILPSTRGSAGLYKMRGACR